MIAQNLMNPNPLTLRPTDTVATGADYILKHRLRHVPVVDDQGRYVGTFSIYSLLRLTLPKAVIMEEGLADVSFIHETAQDLARRLRGRRDEPVVNWLSKDDPVMYPDTSTMEVMLLMLRGRTTSVPVVDKHNHRLEGIISFWNVLENLLAENK
jgi:CBS domain-containing protein